MRLVPFMLVPALTLVAQAPANQAPATQAPATQAPVNQNLVQRFNAELPGVNQLLKELKAPEALARMQALMPKERPAFDATSPLTISQSLDDAQGLMSLYRLYANVTVENGLWEQALELQEQRAAAARGVLVDLEKAQAPIADQWKKVAQDSSDYIAQNEPKVPVLEAKVKAFYADRDALNAEIKTGKKRLTKKEVDDFNARGNQIQKDEFELDQIVKALPIYKQNLANAPKVTKMLSDHRREVEGMVNAADEAIIKAQKAVADQNEEIAEFNTKQVIKKVKIVGKKNWVDAVLRSPENLTKLGTPQAQAVFLNRLLVLDPGNAGAQKALDNLKAGKEAFAKEPKGAKKKAK